MDFSGRNVTLTSNVKKTEQTFTKNMQSGVLRVSPSCPITVNNKTNLIIGKPD